MKKVEIEIHEYCKKKGLQYDWEDNFIIHAKQDGETIILKANKSGLISLAKHLLTLAQDEVPAGYHIHLDELNSLEQGSNDLIIEKLSDS